MLLCFPDLGLQYWFTDRAFAVGEKLAHNGSFWRVENVEERGNHGLVVMLSEPLSAEGAGGIGT